MSATVVSDLILATKYLDEIVDVVNSELDLIKSIKIVPEDGEMFSAGKFRWRVESATGSAASFSENGDFSDYQKGTELELTLGAGQLQSTQKLSGLAQVSVGQAGSFEKLVGIGIKNVLRSLDGYIADGAGYNGTTSLNEIAGLEYATLSTSTYAGKAYGTYTAIAPYKADSDGYAVTLANLRTDIATIRKNSGVRVEKALVSPATLVAIKGLLDSNIQVVKSVGTASFNLYDLSLDVVMIEGVKFVESANITDGTIVYLGLDSVELRPIVQPGWLQYVDTVMQAGGKPLPLPLWIERLAKTGDGDAVSVQFRGQVIVKNPRACGQRINISV